MPLNLQPSVLLIQLPLRLGWFRFADSNSTWRLWLDQKSHVDTGQDQDYCFRLTGSQPLKIQLAWSDYPAQINVQVGCLSVQLLFSPDSLCR